MNVIHSCSKSFFRLPSLTQVNTPSTIHSRNPSLKQGNIRIRKVLHKVSLSKKSIFSLSKKAISVNISPIRAKPISFVQGDEEEIKKLVGCF